MNFIAPVFIEALLADACYVDGLAGLSDSKLALSLESRMTPELAKYIANNFSVVAQTPSFSSSFDATVWKNRASGEIYISMRGTTGLRDLIEDAHLQESGLAAYQITDMV